MTEEKPEEQFPVNKLSKLELAELDTCSRCAQCAEYCPTYTELEERQPELIPGKKVSSLSKLVKKKTGIWSLIHKPKPITPEEIERVSGNLYTCTLCGRCQVACPFSIQTEHLWRTFRAIIFESGHAPEPLRLLDGSIEENKNPYGAAPDLRTLWTEYVDTEELPFKEKAELVYFVGCTSALKGQVQDIPPAIASILNLAGEDWTLLGEDECCCGSPSLMIGNWDRARDLAARNTELFKSKGAKRVVTGCPGCYRALKKYSELLGGPPQFEAFHILELINEYLKDGRLLIADKFKERIVYHDPCELGRLSGIYEIPREVLRAITDNPVEFPESKADSRCCGGGGLLLAADPELRLKIAGHRVSQAEEVEADILVSACPACKMTLLDGLQSKGIKMKMVDLTELVAQKLSASLEPSLEAV